ncbi:MAG: hypothetical protein EOO77_36640 [Oxalobacteraceae bacterium]|nr:MAG: hypothetical protein EOO77_36640 [Oxalobacteraceae bacterium]
MTKIYTIIEYANTPSTNRSYPFAFVFFANNNAWRDNDHLQAFNASLREIEAWGVEQFGDPKQDACDRWSAREGVYMFADRADATAFKLRWL